MFKTNGCVADDALAAHEARLKKQQFDCRSLSGEQMQLNPH